MKITSYHFDLMLTDLAQGAGERVWTLTDGTV